MLGRRWWAALPYAAGNLLLDYSALLAALAATGARPRASLVLLAYVVAALLGMVPITPGGLGFVEVGLVATLGLAGVGVADATLATLAYRLVSFWPPIRRAGWPTCSIGAATARAPSRSVQSEAGSSPCSSRRSQQRHSACEAHSPVATQGSLSSMPKARCIGLRVPG